MKFVPQGLSGFMVTVRFIWPMFATTILTALAIWWWVASIKSDGILTPLFYGILIGLMAMALASLLWPKTFDQRLSASAKRKTVITWRWILVSLFGVWLALFLSALLPRL